MTVELDMDTGETLVLDRRLYVAAVAERVNEGRRNGALIEFQDDRTPSRTLYVDPSHVVAIRPGRYD